MKIPKFLFTAVIAVVGLAHAASAQTAIYLAGAPATRKIWNTAIYNELGILTGGTGSLVTFWTGSTGFDLANQIAITGGTIGGNAVTIYGSWTGSTGGNQSVANTPPATIPSFKIGFINSSALSGTVGGVVSGVTGTNNLEYPQVNLSDTQQITTPFNGSTTVTSPPTTYVPLTEAPTVTPAVTGFEFVANKGAPSTLNNITTNLAQELYTTTGTPLALFTGNSGDKNKTVYPVGRDISSGARYILLAETGIGTLSSDSLVQYEPAVSSGTITNIASNPSASGTINLIAFPAGAGGYPSFSTVETVLSATSSASTGYVVTYLTDSDAVTAIGAGAEALSWNGVPYSVPAIQQGQYTFWSYLHVYYNNTGNYIQTNFPLAYTFANDLASDLATDTTTGAILTSTLQVSRTNDGGIITANY